MERLDTQHRKLHLQVIDLIKDDDEGATEQKEQKEYEEYEDTVSDIQGCIQILLFDIETDKLTSLAKVWVNPADKIHKQLDHIDSDLGKIQGVIDDMVPGTGIKISHLEVYEEQLSGLKMELFHASQGILALDHGEDGLTDHVGSIREEIFCVHKHVHDVFNSIPKDAPVHADPLREESKVSIRLTCNLPKFSLPTFDGDMKNWSNFWDLFSVLIHDKTDLLDTE